MRFKSTRGKGSVSPSEALLKGIAPDGGLYVPESFPDLSGLAANMYQMTYQDLAYEIMRSFFTDFSESELRLCIDEAYTDNFSVKEVTPLKEAGGHFFLELFHGKTLAFKDIALSVLPKMMSLAMKKTGSDKKIIILTATSGDTGKAALEGFAGAKDISIAVFYPSGGVSNIQKLQMITQEGANTFAAGIYGNFDDAQRGVKELFADKDLRLKIAEAGFVFSSANSINIGRLLPQTVYYFRAYQEMVNSGFINKNERINFTVPTGNFGNILAGYYARKMGLPVGKLICASNENRILSDFFGSGIYDADREFFCTISPSMDILVSSNLERLLYDLSCEETVKAAMNRLASEKRYEFTCKTGVITGEYSSSKEAMESIGDMYKKGYVMDPHTAAGFAAYKKYRDKSADDSKNVFIATASPFKFPETVLEAIGCGIMSGFEAVSELSARTGTQIPGALIGLDKKTVRHKTVCEKDKLKDAVLRFLDCQR